MKKIFAVLLAAFMLLSFCLPATAASTKISDINTAVWSKGAQSIMQANAVLNGKALGSTATLDTLSIKPGDELKLVLDASMFLGDDGTAFGAATNGVTVGQLNSGSVTIINRKSAGSSAIKSITLSYDSKAYALGGKTMTGGSTVIKITFVDHFVSTSEQNFSITMNLRVKGNNRTQTEFTVAGTMRNPTDSVNQYTDSVDISDGTVLEASSYVRNLKIDMGDGFRMTTSLYSGNKYYGTASVEYSTADTATLDKYPAIELVYVIRQVNLRSQNKVYTFHLSTQYHVYDENLNYLGTTADAVPYSAKYYLATARIDGGGSASSSSASSSSSSASSGFSFFGSGSSRSSSSESSSSWPVFRH